MFRDGDPYLESDAVFGVSTLVADWVRHPAGAPGSRLDAPYYTGFVLNPKGRRDPAS